MLKTRLAAVVIGCLCVLVPSAFSQGRGGGRAGGRGAGGRGNAAAAQTPRSSAAIDMTGYWVSVVTEDWMFRMVTPPKGQYLGVPLNAAARRVADAWDPAKDEAAGEACKSYGAAALMRVPGRLHITWENDTTLKIETEAGTQTRLARLFDCRMGAGRSRPGRAQKRRLKGGHYPASARISAKERSPL